MYAPTNPFYLILDFSAANAYYSTEITLMQNQQEVFQQVLIVLWMQVYKKYFFKFFFFFP